jgi:Ca2+-binding EF-hand superfamily protein
MLQNYLRKLFAVADVNGDGVLQPEELSRLLELSGFNLTPSQVGEIAAAADVNHDGVISYEEFIPVATQIMKARTASGQNAMPDLSEVPPAMMERYFKKLFTIADTNGDGVLQPEELKKLLSMSGFNFTPAQIDDIMERADINHDGVIEYDEFIPLAVEVVNIRKEAGLAGMPRLSEVPAPMLERYLKKLFTIADSNGDGVLQPAEFKRLLQLSGFNFSPSQVEELMASADVNHDGVIQYEEFIPVAMSILGAQQDSVDDFMGEQDEQAVRQLLLEHGTRPQTERMMKKMFLFADNDCSGELDYQEFKNCINQMGLPLTAVQVTELMKLVDVNQDGMVSYEEFVPVAFELLVKVMSGQAQPQQMSAPPAVAKAAPAPQREGWTAYSSLYKSKAPTDAPVSKVKVTTDSSDVASLEGRVLSVQCRRIIRSKIKDLFSRLDSDNDGRLSVGELTAAFGNAVARRVVATLDRNNDGHVTQYEMRRFFDDECTQATASGVPEYKYLEGVVQMLENA